MMWDGVFFGLLMGIGWAMLWAVYCAARPTLAERVQQGKVSTHVGPKNPWLAALARWWMALIETLGSTTSTVERRLELLGGSLTLSGFRIQQLVAAVVATILFGSGSFLMLTSSALSSVVLPLAFLVLGALTGVTVWDQLLTWRAKRRQKLIDSQVPDTSDLLALALGAGESIPAALERMSRVAQGQLSFELGRTVGELRMGTSTTSALGRLARRNDSRALDRLCQTLITAVERGSPLARVLHDQAQDIRETARQQLMEEGGKREIFMLVPVVFLILPITVLFALYPGIAALRLAP